MTGTRPKAAAEKTRKAKLSPVAGARPGDFSRITGVKSELSASDIERITNDVNNDIKYISTKDKLERRKRLTPEQRAARRRAAFIPVAEELVETTLDLLQADIESRAPELELPPPPSRHKIVEELADSYIKKSRGDERLLNLAFRRLAEEMLRTSIPHYSLATKKAGIPPLKYFAQKYRAHFRALHLGVGSVIRVDGNLHYHLDAAGLLDKLDL